MDWATIGTTVGSVAAIMGFFFTWMNSNINRLDTDLKSLASRMDAMGGRIDAMGARIDTTQTVIMRMLEKQGR